MRGGELMLWQVVPGALLSRVERAWLKETAGRAGRAGREGRAHRECAPTDGRTQTPMQTPTGGHTQTHTETPTDEPTGGAEAPLIVNIGIYKGASMHCLRAGAPDAILVGIDVGIRQIHAADVLRAELICKDSRRMGWDRPIDLLFVDGGHRYEVVRSDIETFGVHVVVGGIMAFHDYARSRKYMEQVARDYPHRPPLGVRRAVDELCTEREGWEVFATVDSIRAFRKVGA